MGYALTKPLDSAPVKIIVSVIIIIILSIIIVFMYIKHTPPFFNDDDTCIPGDPLSTCIDCTNLDTKSIELHKTPLRYIYGLTPNDASTSSSGANLMQMVISMSSGQKYNGGYNIINATNLGKKIDSYLPLATKLGIPNVPYLLIIHKNSDNSYISIPQQYLRDGTDSTQIGICTPGSFIKHDPTLPVTTDFVSCPDIGNISEKTNSENNALASLNDIEWFDYLSKDDTKRTRTKFARFVLCDLTNGLIPLTIYIDDDELVKVNVNGTTMVDKASMLKDNSYKLTNISPYNFSAALQTGGILVGKIGVCNNSTFKFHSFMRKIGAWIMLGLFLLTFLYMFWTWYKNKDKENKDKDK